MSLKNPSSSKRASPRKNVPPPAKKERRDDDNFVHMTLYSKRIEANLELIWCERDPGQDGYTQPLATDLQSEDPNSLTSRYNIFMYGSRRMNERGGVQLNRDTDYPRRYYVRVVDETETRINRLSVMQEICRVRNSNDPLCSSCYAVASYLCIPLTCLFSQFLQDREDEDIAKGEKAAGTNLRNVYSVATNWDRTPDVLQKADMCLTDRYVVSMIMSLYECKNWATWATDNPDEATKYFSGPPYNRIPRRELGYPLHVPDFNPAN